MSQDQKDRLKLQLQQFGKALSALEDAIGTDTGDKKSRDSILLSFVFTFEMAWRSVKRALVLQQLNPPDHAATVLSAGVQGLLIKDLGLWDQIRDARDDVAHAYDEAKAIAIAALVRDMAVGAFRSLLADLQRHA